LCLSSAEYVTAVLIECVICYDCDRYGCVCRVQDILRLYLSSAEYTSITAVLGTAVLIECRIYYGCVRYGCTYRVQGILRLCSVRLYLSSAECITAA